MARSVTRQSLKLFGTSGASSNFGQFGSAAASSPVNTKTISTIQALSAWLNGWQSAVALGQAPYLEDMNSFCYVMAYMQFYVLQEGIAEWDAGTTYFIGSVVKNLGNSGFVEFYNSLTDSNTNNALPTRTNNANWQFMYAMDTTNGLVLPNIGANIPMNSKKLTGLAAGSANGDSLRWEQLKILQVVTASNTTSTTTSSTSYVDTPLAATITPTSSSNNILIHVTSIANLTTVGERIVYGIKQASSDLVANGYTAFQISGGSANQVAPVAFQALASPATTSPVTYTVRIKTGNGTSVIDNSLTQPALITLMEVK